MSISAPSHVFGPAATHLLDARGSTGRPRAPMLQAFAAAAATLHVWRARARERAELATMDARERRDLPFARDFEVRREIAKPFWRE